MSNSINSVFKKYPDAKRDSLISILQDVQEVEGFISKDSIIRIGDFLNLPTSKIYGVATFYNQFRFQPYGKYNIQVCRGTACHVLGSATVLEELEKHLKIKTGETSKDGAFSLEVVSCIGACGLSPVISVNGNFHARITIDKIEEIIDHYRKAIENEKD